MTTGTRIGLALGALLVTVLVVYYGFFTNPATSRAALDALPIERAVDPAAGDSAAGAPVPAMPDDARGAEEDHRASPAGGTAPRGADTMGGAIDDSEARDFMAGRSSLFFDEPTNPGIGRMLSDQAGRGLADDPGKGDPVPTVRDGAEDQADRRAGRPADAQADPQADPHAEPDQGGAAVSSRTPARAASGAPSRATVPPARSNPVPARASVASTWTKYVVKSGDTLTSIAEAWFGDANRWDLIADANGIDPDRLVIGQVLRLPPGTMSRVVAPSTARSYRIRSGDTLSAIAARMYGDRTAWRRLYDANRAVIGSNPGALTVGTELVVPR